jgi:hypothetical protein
VTRRRRLLGVYARIGRTYKAWAPRLMLLAAIVFIPLGFVDALLEQVDVSALDVTGGFKVAALLAAIAAVVASGLLGEVFFSGAIAASLTHPEDQDAPPAFAHIARHISYGKLIAVDLIFVAMMLVGAALVIVPAFLVYVFFSPAGAVVELEKRGVIDGFRRSFRLVRGHFWMVAAVLIPVEILGDAVNDGLVGAAHAALGHGLLAAWVGEAVGNMVTAPVASVAIVLLTLDLMYHRDGEAPPVRRAPTALRPARTA